MSTFVISNSELLEYLNRRYNPEIHLKKNEKLKNIWISVETYEAKVCLPKSRSSFYNVRLRLGLCNIYPL